MHHLEELSEAPSYRLVVAAKAKRLATADLKVKSEAQEELGKAVCLCLDELGLPKGNWSFHES